MTTMIFTTEQTGVAFFGAENMGSTHANCGMVIPVKPAIIFRGVLVFF
jgi:hypothetical protein